MKKVITISCLIASGIIILMSFGVFESLLLFLLAGVIPGTDYVLPSGVMLWLIISVTTLVLFWFTALDIYLVIVRKRDMHRELSRKKRMPRRRYGQI